MQLVAYGVQDVYLTGNPQITYWKVIYKRHTNFAVEPIEQSFSGTADFGKSSVTSLIARNGDLMSKVYLKATVSLQLKNNNPAASFAFVRRIGHAMIKEVEIQIGGARIDRQLGDWMNVWYELTHDISKEAGYAKMIGDTPELTVLSNTTKRATLFIPLYFWFNRNNGLALPLIALQYHDVRINFIFNPASQLVVYDHASSISNQIQASIDDAILLIDYVFLDSEERKRFATSAHEYLIEQLQTPDQDTINEQNKKYRLPFNHPCKEIIWNMNFGKYITGQKFLAYHPTDFTEIQLQIAKAIVLLSINFTDKWKFSTETKPWASHSFASSALNTLLHKLQGGVSLITIPGQDNTASFPAEAFEMNPFNYVEFSNTGYYTTNISLELASTTLAELTASSGTYALGNTITGSNIFSLLTDFFPTVYMPFNYGLYIDGSTNAFEQANIQLNGQDRFTYREGDYFNYVQPYQCHTRVPCDGVNVYSFALNPEEHQPSGTCNFSRIDFSQLNLKLTNTAKSSLGDSSVIYIYTINYNILRIMGGMGGLAYSNAGGMGGFDFDGVKSW